MIICCGEALIDMVPIEGCTGSLGNNNGYHPISGGAIFNTAIALGRLGVPTGFLSGLSNDLFGQQLCDSLSESGVDYRYSNRMDAPTTLSFVKLINGQASYAFYDENTAGRLLDLSHLPSLLANTQALHFGAISLIPEPCGSTYEALMKREYKGRIISFDPNIRTSFISDEISYRKRIDRMLGMSDIVKISDEDLNWLAPGANIHDFAHQLLEKNSSLVLYTEGAKGATAFTKTVKYFEPGLQVEMIDAIGAGDSFNAGVLASLYQQELLTKRKLKELSEEQIRSALRQGNKVAAFTVTQTGSNPPWKKQINL
ncbi:carbohydrate kinase family protein [Kiloniella sp.]|uniref:carbohydrate kinase family protein n=1 Tax=Kiloniella sp. TaxID=1938587 RepID=UPI003B0102EB